MLRINLDYHFSEEDAHRQPLHNPLFALLDAIHHAGSISKAATTLGFSYRHVWGALKKWETLLGKELILWEKGKRAQLSAFGEKLLFAEQRAKARILPQIDILINEMEKEFALAFDENVHIISMHASHDIALNRLRDLLSGMAQLHLNLHFEGSLTALSALSRGECTLAGFHVSETIGHLPFQKILRKLLKPSQHRLIGFLRRQQGLMVRPGNPKKIRGIMDLKRGDLRFINREPGSGTRLEIEELLQQAHIPFSLVNGFEQTESTHLAVAAAVAYQQADVGFGIEAAARQFKLDFIPLLQEQYYFACTRRDLQKPAVQKLISLLKSSDWKNILADLPGYDSALAGDILPLSHARPWARSHSAK